MPIKWKALPVKEAMDRAEAQVILGNEFLKEARKIVREAERGENLPQYITQKLSTISGDIKWNAQRLLERIGGVRTDLPADALKGEVSLRSLGEVKTMELE
ncbi:hypothetical protein LCGC14_2279430 [marine sediment metagenome]|uniref:Uncharacterized protein n=1 Tax=marine sediment metagenome TaxID=412755 RepID=A0A0F9F704_9ZZZZ